MARRRKAEKTHEAYRPPRDSGTFRATRAFYAKSESPIISVSADSILGEQLAMLGHSRNLESDVV